ncbi:MAG: SpoIID/LytB domain-containing protein [Selenomonadaceae bacterium]|nr:SpoIID/LytB domain-containing protein [Selenomonadaceae bacterium]
MKKVLSLITILSFVLSFTIMNTAQAEKPKSWQPELLVGLFISNTPVKLKTNLSAVLINSANNHNIKVINKNTEIVISNVGNRIHVNGQSINCSEMEFRPRNEKELKDMQTQINGKMYRGGVKVIATSSGLSIINIVAVEEYLRGVVPGEMSPSYHEEALKVQAVAARTFALVNRKRHKDSGYDLCNTTHCQVYNGVEAEHRITNKIIDETFGEVLFYNNKLIQALFHTDSGGMTENVIDVWGVDYPYLRAVSEIEKETGAWTLRIPINDFSSKLAAAKHNVGTVKSIKITPLKIGKSTADRTASGRVKEINIQGTKGQTKITGTEMRSIFSLRSTLFEIKISGSEVIINGYGWGHGVGMSQNGAQNLAKHNYTYDKILSHYYKGTTLKRLY